MLSFLISCSFTHSTNFEMPSSKWYLGSYPSKALGEASDEQTRREFYSVIQNQAQRLKRLIENILNSLRIESARSQNCISTK